MIVCLCHRVNDRAIAHCAQQGVAFDELQWQLGVATQCGKCESAARRIWSECHPSQRLLHLHKEVLAPSAATAD